jgi:hypothetical protein
MNLRKRCTQDDLFLGWADGQGKNVSLPLKTKKKVLLRDFQEH